MPGKYKMYILRVTPSQNKCELYIIWAYATIIRGKKWKSSNVKCQQCANTAVQKLGKDAANKILAQVQVQVKIGMSIQFFYNQVHVLEKQYPKKLTAVNRSYRIPGYLSARMLSYPRYLWNILQTKAADKPANLFSQIRHSPKEILMQIAPDTATRS